jgi:hypothetical protein
LDKEELKRRWREKSARTEKAAPVVIDGVGTLYVRLLHVTDSDSIARIAAADAAAYPTIMAGMLCDEDGNRFPKDEVEEWEQIFARATWADYLKLVNAAKGVDEGN